MKKLVILFLIIFLIVGVYATCNESQININTASAEDLDKIINIGPKIALRVIDTRPFSSVDDLIKVSGIGNITLNEIKKQGLACVEGEEKEPEEEIEEVEEQSKNQTEELPPEEQENNKEEGKNEGNSTESTNKNVLTLETIELNPDSKDIKSEDNKEVLKRNLALAGIISFCIIFGGALFLSNMRKRKNEFN